MSYYKGEMGNYNVVCFMLRSKYCGLKNFQRFTLIHSMQFALSVYIAMLAAAVRGLLLTYVAFKFPIALILYIYQGAIL